MEYLKDIGAIDEYTDIHKLTLINKTSNYRGDINLELKLIEDSKMQLDEAKSNMAKQRTSMSSIIESVTKMDKRIEDLKSENKRILNACLVEKNKHLRGKLLLSKMENEEKILELKGISKKFKAKHLSDFSKLKKMRHDVDLAQDCYDNKVSEFKDKVGVNQEAIDNLMVGIYNKFQYEILEHDRKKTRKQK